MYIDVVYAYLPHYLPALNCNTLWCYMAAGRLLDIDHMFVHVHGTWGGRCDFSAKYYRE